MTEDSLCSLYFYKLEVENHGHCCFSIQYTVSIEY